MGKKVRVLRKEGGKEYYFQTWDKSPQRDLAGKRGILEEGGWCISTHTDSCPSPGSHRHPITSSLENGQHTGIIRGIATFLEDLLYLTKTSHQAAGGSVSDAQLDLWPSLSLSCASEDKIGLWAAQRWEMPAYLNSLWASLSSAKAAVPMLSTHQQPDAQSQGQAWITLHRGAQSYVSTTNAPSLRTWLLWVLCILTLKRMSIW